MIVMQQHSPITEITMQNVITTSAENSIGPVAQTNTATGHDDVLIDQDNNVAVSQDLTANNDCDATALNNADWFQF